MLARMKMKVTKKMINQLGLGVAWVEVHTISLTIVEYFGAEISVNQQPIYFLSSSSDNSIILTL